MTRTQPLSEGGCRDSLTSRGSGTRRPRNASRHFGCTAGRRHRRRSQPRPKKMATEAGAQSWRISCLISSASEPELNHLGSDERDQPRTGSTRRLRLAWLMPAMGARMVLLSSRFTCRHAADHGSNILIFAWLGYGNIRLEVSARIDIGVFAF